jgi:hypothetical protein
VAHSLPGNAKLHLRSGSLEEDCMTPNEQPNSPRRRGNNPVKQALAENQPVIGAVISTNNVEVCWPVMKPYVVHVHIKDWKLGAKDIGSMPGEGDGS